MRKPLWAAAAALMVLTAWPSEAWAVFQLTASPRRGGQSIRLQGVEPSGLLRSEEVTLTVSTDRQAQYRILQTVYQPLTSETGGKIPAGAFIFFSPSNPLGTLRTQLETPVSMGQSQIYVSNSGGDSDEFTLVYSVRVPEDQPGGVYRSQLTFTLEPLQAQAGAAPSTVTLEVRVEIDSKFRIEIVSDKGSRALDLGRVTEERPAGEGALDFRITSNTGGVYRIFQQLTEPLTSADGRLLDTKELTFTPSGNAQGSFGSGASSPLGVSPALLYTSNEWGASDRFQAVYKLPQDPSQKAGFYRGNLSFRVESASAAGQEVIQMPVSIQMESIFSLETVFEQGSGINFGPSKGKDRQERHVLLKVHSNLGEPYQVSQVVPRTLSTEDGSPMGEDAFQFSVESTPSGQVKAPSPQPVRPGESVLFVSDSKGTPENVSVRYILETSDQAKAGAYSTQLKYTITTL